MTELFNAFLGSLVSLIMCMMIGFICRRAGIIDDKIVSGLTTLLVKVALPCTVFISMMRPFTNTLLLEAGASFALSITMYLLGGLFGFIVFYFIIKGQKKRGIKPISKPYYNIMIFSLIFANVGYMGYPVIQAVFGEEGMFYASMSNAAFNLLAFTLGIQMFYRHSSQKTNHAPPSTFRLLVFNFALIATVVGFTFFVTGWRLPGPIYNGVQMIGGMTAPISMLIVGAILGKSPLKSMLNDWKVFPLIVARHIILPLAAYMALKQFVPNKTMLGVLIVLMAMPVASITAIFAEEYKCEPAFASKLVVLSTLLSVITVPMIGIIIGI